MHLSLSLFPFLIKRLSTCHFNLVFSLPESLSVSLVDPFTWQILSCPLQRAKGCTAAEHHLRWEACYLNPRSRVPCLPFSWVLTADPDWCSPHAEANSAVKRTHFPTLDSDFFFKAPVHMRSNVFAFVWVVLSEASPLLELLSMKKKPNSPSNFQMLNIVWMARWV